MSQMVNICSLIEIVIVLVGWSVKWMCVMEVLICWMSVGVI